MSINALGQLTYLDISEVGITDGLVGYWKLNGDALDYSGNNNHGIITGSKVTSGLKNLAYDFNGTTDLISGSMSTTFIGGNDWSISGWFLHRTTKQWSSIFSLCNGINSAPLLTFINTTNSIGINNVGVSATAISVDLGVDHFNKWIFTCITKLGNTFYVYAYKDGNLIQSSGAVYWTVANSNNFYIGRHYTSEAQLHDGKIADVRIYNRALSTDEILIQYKQGLPSTGMQMSSDGTVYLNGEINETI